MTIGAQGRLIAIGDVHGQDRALEALLTRLAPRPEDRLVFLGDYIDRGPNSHGVIERLIGFGARFPRTIFLRGNHDQWLLNWLFGEDDTFLYLGGRQTRASYARAAGLPVDDADPQPAQLLALLPAAHLRFLDETRLTFTEAGYIFVHGGLDPARPGLEEQSTYDILMSHRNFFRHRRYPQMVVVGHTSTQIFRRDQPVLLPNGIIMCDTSSGPRGSLSAIDLGSGRVEQVPLQTAE